MMPTSDIPDLRTSFHPPHHAVSGGDGDARAEAVLGDAVRSSTRDEALDRIARLAATACAVPMAVVTVEQAEHGRKSGALGITTIDADEWHPLIARALRDNEHMAVEDLSADELFATSSLVRSYGARACIAVPIRTRGGILDGALCIFDTSARSLPPAAMDALFDLAHLVGRELEVSREQNAHFKLFETHPHPMWIYEVETLRMLAVNDRALQEYGYSRDEFLRMRITDFRPAPDIPGLLQEITHLPPTHTRTGPVRQIRADGSLIYVDEASQPVQFEGRPARLVMVTDVTEKVTWMRAHQATEERFRILVESIEEYAVVLLDPVGRVVSWNRGAERLYGYRSLDVIGRSAVDLFPAGEDARRQIQRYLLDRATVGPFRTEAQQVRRDGSDFWADILFTPLKSDQQQVLGYAQVTRDVTRRREHDRALVEARIRAERLNAMKTEKLTRLSHDVRTPLTGILGSAALLVEEGPDAVREFASAIHRSGQFLLDTLDTAVEFIHLENETEPLPVEPVRIDALVESVVERFSTRAADQGLELCIESLAKSDSAYADADTLRRVLGHLLRNALKFTNHGEITVRTRSTKTVVIIEVEDTGIGMTESFLQSVFEPFAQEDHTFARPASGNGLGLPIVHRQLERMGGSISAWSDKGVGSRFSLSLPAAG